MNTMTSSTNNNNDVRLKTDMYMMIILMTMIQPRS